jgi:hypothetical protein
MIILAIDPGPLRSAWVNLAGQRVIEKGIDDNEYVLWLCKMAAGVMGAVVIERVEGYGMPVGVEVFETVWWSGRMAEAARPLPVHRIGRKAVKLHLCGSTKAKDGNVRQALIDRFGPSKEAAVGVKASPGPLFGVSRDVWAALALAVTFADQRSQEAAP